MKDDLGLLNGSDHVAGADPVPCLSGRLELPYPVALQGGYGNSAAEVVAADLHDIVKRTLDAVVYALDKARAELDRKLTASRYDGFAGAEAGGLFIYLYRGEVAVHLDDFADEIHIGYVHDVEHVTFTHTFGYDQRAGYLFYYTCTHRISPLYSIH